MKSLKLVLILLIFICFASCKKMSSTSKAGGIGDSIEVSFSENIDSTKLESAVKPFLTSELATIKQTNQVLPDEASEDYVKIYDNTDSDGKRIVTIVGKKLIIEDGNENGVYEYNNEVEMDEINFYAETILVKDSFRIKKGNINIYARNLEFEGSSQLITTPDANEIRPVSPVNGIGVNGEEGAKGGDISLNIENLILPANNSIERFILKGATGQPAGLGQKGNPGKNASRYNFTYANGSRVTSKNISSTSTPFPNLKANDFNNSYSAVYYEIRRYNSSNTLKLTRGGKNNWPTNGYPAIPGGLPGMGGEGGNIISNISIPAVYDISHGHEGLLAEKAIGGDPGYPNTCAHISVTSHTSYHSYRINVNVTTKTYVKGPDAEAPIPDPFGAKDNGTYTVTNSLYSWIQPLYLRTILNYSRDMYLKGFTTETLELAQEYNSILSNYMLSDEWNQLTDEVQLELNVVKNEFMSIIDRIASEKDYFGNPAGWVPRLSFEVTKAMYEEEVDRSFNIMKLAYIITKSHENIEIKFNALKDQRQKIAEEIDIARKKTNEATEKIPGLQTECAEINSQIDMVQEKLEDLEESLLKRAEANVKGPAWKRAARFLGTVAACCPVGQPALGSVGRVLDVIGDQDNFSQLLDWGAIKELGTACSKVNFSDIIDALKTAYSGNECYDSTSGFYQESWTVEQSLRAINELKNLNIKITDTSKELNRFNEYIKPKKVSSSELEKELNKLRNRCPEYNELSTRLENLKESENEVLGQIETAVDTIAKSGFIIQTGVLAINSINIDLEKIVPSISKPTIMYIEEIDRSAKERLLMYHYYMAKAYEYRLVEPYSANLDIHRLYDHLLSILELNRGINNLEISSADFDDLKAIYKDQIISPIVNTIYDRLLTGEFALKTKSSFFLGEKDLARLNDGKSITLNLKDLGIFRENEENIRIANIRISQIETINIGDLTTYADMDIIFKHSGESFIERDGNQYLFRHYNNLTRNSISWTTRFDPFDEVLSEVKPAYSTTSLIHSILNKDDDVMLFAMPSAWADITISKDVNANNVDIRISKARIEVEYCYVPKSENKCEIRIMPNDNRIMPDFTLSAKDTNDKQDGSGYFIRTYQKSATNMYTVTAPETYGEWTFEKWIDANGVEISSNNVYSFRTNENQTLIANYVTTNELILNPDESLEDIPTEDLPIE